MWAFHHIVLAFVPECVLTSPTIRVERAPVMGEKGAQFSRNLKNTVL